MTTLVTHSRPQEVAATAPHWCGDDASESFENRWAAWQSQRLARDARIRRRMLIISVVGGLATFGWVAGAVLHG